MILTPEEQAYIQAHGPFKYVAAPASPPFEFMDEQGIDLGIAVDFRHLIEVRTGVRFTVLIASNLTHAAQLMLDGTGDVAGWMSPSPERQAALRFTSPHTVSNIYAWGYPEAGIGRDAAFAGQALAAIAGTHAEDTARSAFPAADLKPVNSTTAGLDLVKSGAAKAYVGSLPTIAYEVRRLAGYQGMVPLGSPLETTPHAFAVATREPMLLSVLEKGLSAVSLEERQAIFMKWTGRDLSGYEAPRGLDVQRALLVAGATVVGVVVLAIPVWTVQLRSRVKRKTTELSLALDSVKASERQERLAREKADAANEALDAFAYSVSHDLRAPLRGVGGFASILHEEHQAALSADAAHCVDEIAAGVKDMGQLIDDLLAFSRLSRQPLAPAKVAMAALVQQVVAEATAAHPGRDIEFKVGSLPDAAGDPSLLRHVWTNLIDNAVKFTAPRRPAVIEVGGSREPGGRDVTYFVQDNGVGFDMAYADKLFGVFQRLHRSDEFPGTGVGLAIVKRIVTRHGGTAAAQGEPDKGARFTFTLPGDPL